MTLSTKIEVFYGFYICSQWAFIHALLSRVPFALAGLSCSVLTLNDLQNTEASGRVLTRKPSRLPAHAQYTRRDGARETRDQTDATQSDTWRTTDTTTTSDDVMMRCYI